MDKQKINVGDLVECGDVLGRVTKIEVIDGKTYGKVDGFNYALSALAWVPDLETIHHQKEISKQESLRIKRDGTGKSATRP